MMLNNTRASYGLVAQLLHWSIAVLILALIPLGLLMQELPEDSVAQADRKLIVYSLHKTVGITLFVLAVIRVIWASVQPHPRLLNADKKLEAFAAQTVHWILYGAIIVMPVTGWLYHAATEGLAPIWWPFSQDLPFIPKDPDLASFFGVAHTCTVILLGLALVLHIGGALKHAVVDRDGTLRRMIPGMYKASAEDIPETPVARRPALLAALSFLVLAAAVVLVYEIGERSTDSVVADIGQVDAAETGWIVDMQSSQINIRPTMQGSPLNGTFGNWDAAITFDPDDLEAANVVVTIDIGSLTIGSVTEQAISPDYLNAAGHPFATFTSDDFVKTGENAFEARGLLSLAGQEQPLTLPFSLEIRDGRAFAEGVTTTDRLAFGIGPSGGMVGPDVEIEIILEATKSGE
ncbi:MAG: cytochrome b/b6 domain-containing protein [Pseudomonadota bacterium]